ncbi:hypothetical protein KNT98_gp58 [Gordonia phage Frokostdame]|uniref:Uncharacterized protein n=1 Tax=Gordonia phage Frokostdame TaxID=2250320 RepID=A0A345L348_9CAUD|nr:hypothetical protein KNT98_gp58 [Gordonia phage Frokostdame]AXH49700.1 hypothetical protein SEA_FROKOSTDAME_58 [Gordonia phage Frokostdame]
MKTYRITNSGCDDHTECDIDLTDTEVATVRKVVAELNSHSEYGCQPTIQINTTGDDQQ